MRNMPLCVCVCCLCMFDDEQITNNTLYVFSSSSARLLANDVGIATDGPHFSQNEIKERKCEGERGREIVVVACAHVQHSFF